LGQTDENERYMQVSGMITDEANRPVSEVAIISKKLKKGTLSESTGIYSITSTPGDTIFFRALGFKSYHIIIPVSDAGRHSEVDIVLMIDTIQIKEVNIMPWKNYSEFIKDISKPKPVDPIVEEAIVNQNNSHYKVSPEAGYRYAMEQNFVSMSTREQYPYNNLLNPFAWAKLIKGIKNGMFKNQRFPKSESVKARKKIKKARKIRITPKIH
jgi:hypothetical protein